MIINIGTVIDDIRKVNKSFTISDTIDNAEIFTESDLLTPQLIVSRARYNPTYNYIYVPVWGRYYYISDVAFDGQKTILNCKVDVLMSFKDSLKNCTCILSRSGGLSKATYIPDKAIPLTGKAETRYITFPNQIPRDNGNNFVLITSAPNSLISNESEVVNNGN